MSDLNGNVTIEAIEQQIEEAKRAGNSVGGKKFDARNYLDTRLKNGENSKKIRIRILPVSAENHSFCLEFKTHSLKVPKEVSKSGYKLFFCLNDEQIPNRDKSVKCPICEKARELFKAAKDLKAKGEAQQSETLYKKACSLMGKSTYVVRVIDRDHENEGVKFWRFNKNSKGEGIFDKLITLYRNRRDSYRENGRGDYNIFDLSNGRDIILTVTRQFDKKGGELPPSYQLDAEDFEKPLSKDVEQMNAWINDTKKWSDVYGTRPAEYLRIIAEDGIPVKDANGKWIAKAAAVQEKAERDEAVMQAQSILEEQSAEVNSIPEGEADDLPF